MEEEREGKTDIPPVPPVPTQKPEKPAPARQIGIEEIGEETKEKIKEKLKKGELGKDIAIEFGVSDSTVSRQKALLDEEDDLASMLTAQEFNIDRVRKVLHSAPGISKRVADYIIATLDESATYQNPQGVFSLVASIGKQNVQSATIITNRIFGNIQAAGSQDMIFPGLFQTGSPTGTPALGLPTPQQTGMNQTGIQPTFPPQPQPTTPQLTEEKVAEIIANVMKKEREKDELTKLREEIQELKSGASRQDSQYIEIEEPLLNPKDGQPIKDNAGNIIVRKKRVPISLASQPEQEDPVSTLRRIMELKKEVLPDEDKKPQSDPAVVALLDQIVKATTKPDTDPQMQEQMKKLEIDLEKEKIRREVGVETSKLERDLAVEKMKADSRLTPEQKLTDTVVKEGLDIAKGIKQDLSDTKAMARQAVLHAVKEPPLVEGDNDWQRAEELSEEELKEFDKGLEHMGAGSPGPAKKPPDPGLEPREKASETDTKTEKKKTPETGKTPGKPEKKAPEQKPPKKKPPEKSLPPKPPDVPKANAGGGG